MMSHKAFLFAAVSLFAPTNVLAENRIYLKDQTINLKAVSNLTIYVLCDTDQVITTIGIAIKYDKTQLKIISIDSEGTIADSVEWFNSEIIDSEGKLRYAIVTSTSAPPTKIIPVGEGIIFANLHAEVMAKAPGTTDLTLQDGLGQPPGGWLNMMSYMGEASIHPLLQKGTITFIAISDFIRGEANADGTTDISDAVAILNYLFLGGTNVPCEQAGDVNDDGLLDFSDGIYVLNFLFTGGKAIEPPVGVCGVDPNGHALPCADFPGCE